jgi:hypothetical protein
VLISNCHGRPNRPCYSSHKRVASSIVEKKMAEFNKNLWSYQLTMKDVDALDEDNEGGGKCQPLPHGVTTTVTSHFT